MKQILLVDDEPNYRASIKALFRSDPYQFIEAESPQEGIGLLRVNPQMRVVVLDLSFGEDESAALTLLDDIKDRANEYRVIVLTGHDELLGAERAREYAIFTYLPKADRSGSQAIRFSIEQAFKDLESDTLHRKVQFLLDIQEKISGNHDTNTVLDEICRSARLTVGAYTCHIRVYDGVRGDYHLRGFAGPHDSLRQIFQIPKAKGDLFSGRVVENKRAEYHPNLQTDKEFREFARIAVADAKDSPLAVRYWENARSAYIAPIFTGLFWDNVDAVLNVSSDLVDFFDAEKQSHIKEFVTLAALAITKDWLQRNRDDIHRDYSSITKMMREITDGLRGADVLKATCEVVTRRISKIVDPEVVSVFLYNDATDRIENIAELRRGELLYGLDEFYRPGESLVGAVYESEETIHLPDPKDLRRVKPLDDPRYDHTNKEGYVDNIPTGSLEHYLGVPIRIGGKVRGVLRAMNKKSKYYADRLPSRGRLCLLERGFSADCRNAMEITASHLAVAITNAELFKEKDRQVERIRALGEAMRVINSALDVNQILDLAVLKIVDLLQAEICLLFLREGEDYIKLTRCYGMPMIAGATARLGEGVTGRVAETGRPQTLGPGPKADERCDLDVADFLAAKEDGPKSIESAMVVPIKAKNTILGVIKLLNKMAGPRTYGDSDLDLLKTFAASIGVAIENAQDYAAAERNGSLSQLVRVVAHEINNTSGTIPASVKAIREYLHDPDEDINRMLSTIDDAANQALGFANELAGFSANQMGEKRSTDVNVVIRQTIQELNLDESRHKNARSVKVELVGGEHSLKCEIYRRSFAQIIRNLVINAVEALEDTPGGEVRISTSKGTGDSAGIAIIRVQDNGPGIKPGNLEKIFKADFTTKPKGQGIGLWLVETQLGFVGGKIEVDSQLGHGATFTIRLPISSEKEVT